MIHPVRYIDGATWVRTWREAGPRLEAIRVLELQSVDVAHFIRSMTDALESVRTHTATSVTSGLVEQQRIFGRRAR